MHPCYTSPKELTIDDIFALKEKYSQTNDFLFEDNLYKYVIDDTLYNITKNFTNREFVSCCKDVKAHFLLYKGILLLQNIRDEYGAINITSTFRTENCNADMGGAIQSQHQLGTAIDFCIINSSQFNRFKCGIQNKECIYYILYYTGVRGIGLYDRHIHLDFRKQNYISVWEGVSKLSTQ